MGIPHIPLTRANVTAKFHLAISLCIPVFMGISHISSSWVEGAEGGGGGGYVAKVACILCHWGVQLILAYSWARLVILVAGKG